MEESGFCADEQEQSRRTVFVKSWNTGRIFFSAAKVWKGFTQPWIDLLFKLFDTVESLNNNN